MASSATTSVGEDRAARSSVLAAASSEWSNGAATTLAATAAAVAAALAATAVAVAAAQSWIGIGSPTRSSGGYGSSVVGIFESEVPFGKDRSEEGSDDGPDGQRATSVPENAEIW